MKKGFILGFLCAALLFTAIGATAAQYTLTPATVKLIVDGTEVKDDKLPLLYMEPGYNYLPAATFRAICDITRVLQMFRVENPYEPDY